MSGWDNTGKEHKKHKRHKSSSQSNFCAFCASCVPSPLLFRSGSQQQGFDAVGVNHGMGRGPGENRELAVLGCDERDAVLLIDRKLGRRQVPRAAQMSGIDDPVWCSLDRFGQQNLLDAMNPIAGQDFGAEGKRFKLVRKSRWPRPPPSDRRERPLQRRPAAVEPQNNESAGRWR